MTDETTAKSPTSQKTVPAALQQWREAERSLAVSRKGKQAAEAAEGAAAEAVEAALATAAAAGRAAEASAVAEASAGKTAQAAKIAARTTIAESADADTEVAFAEAGEQLAKHYYSEAQRDAADKA